MHRTLPNAPRPAALRRATLRGLIALTMTLAWTLGCGGSSANPANPSPQPTPPIPALGSATTLDIGAWNLEWFGDPGNGPANESTQQQNVRNLIAGVDCDLWGLEEVVSESAFNTLVSGLPGYAGLLVSDPSVTQGSAYYGPTEQKVALLYKTGLATVQDAQVILTAHDYDFAGRPPMEVKLGITLNGSSSTLYVICLHAKAGSDTTSYGRRVNASAALKGYLDTVRAGEQVIVLGDFNDDLDTSITLGQASPYQNFLADTAAYFAPTKALSDARLTTILGYADPIDHHLVSSRFATRYIQGSVQAFRADQYFASFSTSTTDHLPVITRWTAP